MPLDPRQQDAIRALTDARVAEAGRLFGRAFAPVPVRFDLRGRAAGQFRFRCQGGARDCLIRYNPWVFAADLEHHQSDTVAHEVAHYIVHLLHPRAKPHGREWKELMRRFGATPLRQQRRHTYRCACPGLVHSLSTTRHRRIQRGAAYLCRGCRTPLSEA
jgi:SprT protein